MLKVTLILIFISISTLAGASDWKYIGANNGGDICYVDTESLLVDGDTRWYWSYVKLKEPQQLVDGKVYNATISQRTINCAKRTVRTLVGQFLGPKNNHIKYVDFRACASDQPIIPDSMDDIVREYVCSVKKRAE